MPVWISTKCVWLLVLLLGVAGCANREMVGTNIEIPAPPPFTESGQIDPPDHWWTEFEDSVLDELVCVSFQDNFSLAAATHRLRAARAFARRKASDLFPAVNGVADFGSSFGPGDDQTIFQWGLDASYQVDLWGQIGSRAEAEQLRADATQADYHAIALTLSALDQNLLPSLTNCQNIYGY